MDNSQQPQSLLVKSWGIKIGLNKKLSLIIFSQKVYVTYDFLNTFYNKVGEVDFHDFFSFAVFILEPDIFLNKITDK